MQAVAGSKPFALETCSDTVCYLIGFNAEYLRYKGACHDSQTEPVDALWICIGIFAKHFLQEDMILLEINSVYLFTGNNSLLDSMATLQFVITRATKSQ